MTRTATTAISAKSATTAPATRAQSSGVDLAAFASLLADSTRAAFCLALLDGRAWTAGELARHAGVAASTATEHLHLLVSGGLLTEERQGRNRYVRLADEETADLVERLATAAPQQAQERAHDGAPTLSAANRNKALARGRTCYDHLAGTLGVTIMDAMTERGLISRHAGLAVTEDGERWLSEFGIRLPRQSRRPPVRSCLDWTERRPHLGGAVGAALCARAFESGWIRRIGTGRAVAVTLDGSRALRSALGIATESKFRPG